MKSKLIIFTGPSGVGKATIEQELFKDKSLRLSFSVSATTRKPREGEIDGVHYHFLSMEEFDKRIANGEFIEWNAHFSNKYGTLISEVERIKAEGLNPMLEIETVGAKNVMNKFGKDQVLAIFIAPPSVAALRERIRARGSETEAQLEERVSRVDEEMADMHLFNYVVVNDDLHDAVNQVKSIIKGELE